MKQTATIVLLGGGYVTVWAYRSLFRLFRNEIKRGQVRILVLCPEEYHVFHGWTAESLTGIIKEENRLSPLSDLLSGAELIRGRADELDTEKNLVYFNTTSGERLTIHYDHLLIGIGSKDNTRLPGMREFGYQVKCTEDLHRTKQRIESLVEEAALSGHRRAASLLDFTVTGAGLTGVELVANLSEYISRLCRRYPSLQTIRPVVRLVCSGESILPAFQARFDRLIQYAEKAMADYNIILIRHTTVAEIKEQGFISSDGRFIRTGMLISTIGQTRVVLKGTGDMERDGLKRLYTNRYLQLKNRTNIWGGGDACHVPHCKTGEACPSNALWAIKHGEAAGTNIARSIQGRPLKKFNFKGLGQTASLGIGKGIGELYGIQFTGWIAWIMRWLFFHYFMPSRKIMLHAVSDWMRLLFTGKRREWSEGKRKFSVLDAQFSIFNRITLSRHSSEH